MDSSPSVPQPPMPQGAAPSQLAVPQTQVSAYEAGVALDDHREDGLQLTPEQISHFQAIVYASNELPSKRATRAPSSPVRKPN